MSTIPWRQCGQLLDSASGSMNFLMAESKIDIFIELSSSMASEEIPFKIAPIGMQVRRSSSAKEARFSLGRGLSWKRKSRSSSWQIRSKSVVGASCACDE